MKIKVDAKELYALFEDFVKGAPVMFNFLIDQNACAVQVIDDYTVNTGLNYEIVELGSGRVDMTVRFTKEVLIMAKEGDVILHFADETLLISDGVFELQVLKEYEERREYPIISEDMLKPAYSNRLKYLVHSAISCVPMAKELGITEPDPVFANGKFYCDYRQAFFIEHMEFPEVCITFKTLRSFIFKLEEDAKYAYLKDNDVLVFVSGNYMFWIPVSNHNIDGATINAVTKKYMDCEDVTTICFKDLKDRLAIIPSAFPKMQVSFSVGENEYSFVFNRSLSHFAIGTVSKYLLSLKITTAQLGVIMKLFGDEDEVKIKRGGNCICLESKEKSMLIAGMIY